MSRQYFFTEIDILSEQTSAEAFGPITPSGGMDKFRVVSLHSSTANPKAIAVTKSELCVQEVTGSSTLVNIILKPLDKPSFDAPDVKFYVYKGVLKSSLISSGLIEQSNLNNLTTSLNDINDKINQSMNDATDPVGTEAGLASENTLGVHLNATYIDGASDLPFEDTDPIDNLFIRNDSNYTLPIVNAGWHIGDFDPSEFGLMIIAGQLSHKVPLSHAREIDTILEVASLAGTSSLEIYQHYKSKDALLSFVDPSAFYGSFYYEDLWAKESGGTEGKYQKDEVYDDILRGPHDDSGPTKGNFFNRNTIYLDIRNEHSQSLNFNQNYGEDIRIGFGASPTMSSTTYYSYSWPLHIIQSSFWSSGNTNEFDQFTLQLPIGDNPDSTVVISQGFRKSLGNLKSLKDRHRFEANIEDISGFTREVVLYTPNNSTAGTTTPISSIVRLLYCRNRIINENLSDLTFPNLNHLDNIFPISDLQFPYAGTNDYMIYSDQTQRFIDDDQTGLRFVANLGIAQDISNVYFFTTAVYRNKRPGLFSAKKAIIAPDFSESQESFLTSVVTINDGWTLRKEELILGVDTVEIAEIGTRDSGLFKRLTVPEQGEVIILALAMADYNSIQGLMGASSFIGTTYLSLKNKLTQKDDLDQEYTTYDVYLTGYVDNAGTLELSEIDASLKIYNYDR